MVIIPLNNRVRDNSVFGTVDDNPLTAVATSMNSSGLPNLSTIAASHATITLDPLRQYGNPEIIIVTSHTASATIATMTRGAYNTVPREHPQGTLWVHAALNNDFIQVVTSSTRPLDPYEGQFIFETDTNKLVGYGGVDWAPRDAGGQLGYAINTTGDQAVANSPSETALTGLSALVTVGTGRRVKITVKGSMYSTASDDAGFIRIKEDATVLMGYEINRLNGTNAQSYMISVVTTPIAGVHTYTAAGLRSNGTGAVSHRGSSTNQSFILVEDIGAA